MPCQPPKLSTRAGFYFSKMYFPHTLSTNDPKVLISRGPWKSESSYAHRLSVSVTEELAESVATGHVVVHHRQLK